MNILDSLKAESPDQPVKGERREQRQEQQPPGELAFHPSILRKFHQAVNPDTPEQESKAILQVLYNLPLLPPATKAQWLAGNLPVADLVTRLRGYQIPRLKAHVAPLVQKLNFFQSAAPSQEEPTNEPPVSTSPAPEESGEMPLPGSESSSRQRTPKGEATAPQE
jgi:hypothetical protein